MALHPDVQADLDELKAMISVGQALKDLRDVGVITADQAQAASPVNQRGPSEPGASPRGTHECA